MRKYILYIFVLALGLALYFFTRSTQSESIVFYGFSENKEQELNFDYDVKVVQVMVNGGQYVSAGDPLLKVERTSDPLRFGDLENKISMLTLRKEARMSQIRNDLKGLRSSQAQKLKEIDYEIEALHASIARNKVLLSVLDEGENEPDTELKGAKALKIEDLENRKKSLSQSTNIEISAKNNELASAESEFDLALANLNSELQFYQNQEKDHILKAPADGTVGFINCSPGENYSSFSKLLSLYL